MADWRWQWVSNRYGPQGWFTQAEKTAFEKKFKNGRWRKLTTVEVDRFKRYLAHLRHSQA